MFLSKLNEFGNTFVLKLFDKDQNQDPITGVDMQVYNQNLQRRSSSAR